VGGLVQGTEVVKLGQEAEFWFGGIFKDGLGGDDGRQGFGLHVKWSLGPS
jgi:hypothetical protein